MERQILNRIPIGIKVRLILNPIINEKYDSINNWESNNLNKVIKYITSLSGIEIVKADKEDEIHASYKGIKFLLYDNSRKMDNGYATVINIDPLIETASLPDAIIVEGKIYIAYKVSCESINVSLKKLILNRVLQYIDNYSGLSKFIALETITSNQDCVYRVINESLYEIDHKSFLPYRLVWDYPKQLSHVVEIPDFVSDIAPIVTLNWDNAHIIKGGSKFWDKHTLLQFGYYQNKFMDKKFNVYSIMGISEDKNGDSKICLSLFRIDPEIKILKLHRNLNDLYRLDQIDLETVYEKVEEIELHGFVYSDTATRVTHTDFIKNNKMLPNLKIIKIIDSNEHILIKDN